MHLYQQVAVQLWPQSWNIKQEDLDVLWTISAAKLWFLSNMLKCPICGRGTALLSVSGCGRLCARPVPQCCVSDEWLCQRSAAVQLDNDYRRGGVTKRMEER